MARREIAATAETRNRRIEASLGERRPDVFRFRVLPDARSADLGWGRVLSVGPGKAYQSPKAAARAARDGDVIEIDAGTYRNDSASWSANGLIIRAVGGGVYLNAKGGALVQNKAIWVITGDNVRIENIEFGFARSPDQNGAGIRSEGAHLHVVSCYFHDNESGLLASNGLRNSVTVESSEFARNGHPSGQAHQIYIGSIGSFVLEGSYFHETIIGSAVKSRARRSLIRYNRIVDEERGRANYMIDLANGGHAAVIGNVIQQGMAPENNTLITFAPEGADRWEDNRLFVVNNTLVNDLGRGIFIHNHAPTDIYVYNNLMLGAGSVVRGPAIELANLTDQGEGGVLRRFAATVRGWLPGRQNLVGSERLVQSRAAYDYRLIENSPAIDAGLVLDEDHAGEIDVQPAYEYLHPLAIRPRQHGAAIDVGAFEYSP